MVDWSLIEKGCIRGESEEREPSEVTEIKSGNITNQIWESTEISSFRFASEFNSYMRGMATLQTFEELPCEDPDNRNVRKHLHFCLHAYKNRLDKKAPSQIVICVFMIRFHSERSEWQWHGAAFWGDEAYDLEQQHQE